MDNDIKRIEELVEKLNIYANMYYDKDSILVSDAEYDKLYDELVALEKKANTILPNSPTLRVGTKANDGFTQHTHINRLWSLDKCKSYDELRKWDERTRKSLGTDTDITYSLEYKFDGLAINLTYDNSQLIQATTRGNGVVGESILAQVKTISAIPLHVNSSELLEIQGEGIMRLSTLQKYNKDNSEPLKNARNAAAGALRNLDPQVTATRHLDCFLYQVGYTESTAFADHGQMQDFAQKNGFKINDFQKKCSGIEQVISYIEQATASRSSLDFLIDGMVIKVWEYSLRESLGYTHRFPKWAIAYKFEAQEVSTTVDNITWQVGRTGRITPVAELTPVELGGVTVARATLNNYNDIQKKSVKIGSRVLIRRSNDVIPEILGALDHDGQDIDLIDKCPACGMDVVENGAHLFCTNTKDCPPQIIGKIVHFASRNAMDIENLNDKTAQLLHDELGIHSIVDLYSLTADKLLPLDGFKEKKAKNLIAGLQKSKTPNLANFIFALGINNIGLKTATDLAKTYQYIDKIIETTYDDLIHIPDIGGIVAQSIVDYFGNENNVKMINHLVDAGIDITYEETKINNILSNNTFVITGTLTNMSRNEAKALIEQNGGKVSSSISKNTTYLLAGESAGSKMDKATKLGTKIIDVDQLMEIISNEDR